MTAAEYGDVNFASTLPAAETANGSTPLIVITTDGITHLKTLMDNRYIQGSNLEEMDGAKVLSIWAEALAGGTTT